jgi:hypothetical protein
MTDSPAEPVATAPPPVITGNIRAEMARRGISAATARRMLGRRGTHGLVAMSPTTWETRMREPGSWKWRELERLAEILGVSPAELVRGA